MVSLAHKRILARIQHRILDTEAAVMRVLSCMASIVGALPKATYNLEKNLKRQFPSFLCLPDSAQHYAGFVNGLVLCLAGATIAGVAIYVP